MVALAGLVVPALLTPSSADAGSDVFDRVIPGHSTVLYEHFNREPLGPVSPSSFNSAVGPTSRHRGAYEDMRYVRDAAGPGHAVRVTLKKGTIINRPAGTNGAVLFVALPRAYDRACLRYRVRFSPGFDWSLGGKLPGLLGVAPGTSPGTPTGGGPTEAGWSGRVMWLGPEAYSWAGRHNMGVTYLYHPGQSGHWGDNLRWNRSFVAGRWHVIRQCHVMNTVGRANGQLLVWLDGELVRQDTGVRYRTRADVHITHLSWSVFRGGNTLRWAGDRDGYVDLDSVRVVAR